MTYATEIRNSLWLRSNEIDVWDCVSGVFVYRMVIVVDKHNSGKNLDPHLNVRITDVKTLDGDKVPKRLKKNWPLPSELTSKHYKLPDRQKILSELFPAPIKKLFKKEGN